MKFFSANITSLSELYLVELAKALDAEETIAAILPRMIERADDPEVRQAFRSYRQRALSHVDRIKRMLRDQNSESCKPIRAFASSIEDTIKDVTNPQSLDIALVGAAQQMEHHQIALYGTLRTWARSLARGEAYLLLKSMEADERNGDDLLSGIAERLNAGSVALAA